MPEDSGAVGFRTSLFGFKKADVLACIDKLAAEGQEKDKQAEAHAQELQSEIDALQEDKTVLLEKAKEICEELSAQKKRAGEAEAAAEALREQLHHAEEESASFKKRLFEREKDLLNLKNDNTSLKSDNETLTGRLREQQRLAEDAVSARQQAQQEMERSVAAAQADAERKASEAVREAGEQAQAARRAAQREAEEARQALEQEARQQRTAMTSGAQQIADSVSVLKAQLAEVDAKIAEAAKQLARTTAALHSALGETEENVKLLGAQMQQFPAPAPGAKLPEPPQPEPAAQRQHDSHPQSRQGKTLSALLLDKLTRMLGD